MAAEFEMLVPGGHARLVSDIKDLIDQSAPKMDAYAPKLTAGAAESVTGNASATAQYLRRAYDGADGVATVTEIRGETLVWNQLTPNVSSGRWGASSNVTKTVDSENNSITITSNTSSSGTKSVLLNNLGVAGHKYYVAAHITNNSEARAYVGLFKSDGNSDVTVILEADSQSGRYAIVGAASNPAYFAIRIQNGTESGKSATFKDIQLVDLTLMFGAGNEPSTVAEFEALYPKPYYPYDAGSLLPVQMEGIATEDAGNDPLDERLIPVSDYFPTGMKRAGTVYDELTADTAIVRLGIAHITEVDAVSLPTNGTHIGYTLLLDGKNGAAPADVSCICDKLTTYQVANSEFWQATNVVKVARLSSTSGQMRCFIHFDGAEESVDDFNAKLTAIGGIDVIYPLETPTTTPIDPPLNLAYRVADGGTEEVMVPTGEMSAPPTMVTSYGYTAESLRDAVLSAIAPVENHKASTNYAIGSYLVHGGQLCKVTVAIATGESITIGTNVTATTVMAELLALTE